MEQPERSDRKVGRGFLTFAGLCLVAAFIIALSMLSGETVTPKVAPSGKKDGAFGQNGAVAYKSHNALWPGYLEASSSQRTLDGYYSLRQYAGSPPQIPHAVEKSWEEKTPCLTCHAKGGWTEEFKQNTPRTPHPLQANCLQCHAKPETDTLFRANEWQSTPPPLLGRSHLPGAPPPIAHGFQMREDCIACHVGPGAVGAIRVNHAARGNCRQCHLPKETSQPFRRQS